jgi:hypothetical protein
MRQYLAPLCSAAAIVGAATLGLFQLIDQSTMMTMIIVLSATGWMGRGSCRAPRRA